MINVSNKGDYAVTKEPIKIERDRISISRLKEILSSEQGVKVNLEDIRSWAIEMGYIQRQIHKDTQDIVYPVTDLGSNCGFKSVEMHLKTGKIQSGIFLDQKAVDLFIEKYPVKEEIVDLDLLLANAPNSNEKIRYPWWKNLDKSRVKNDIQQTESTTTLPTLGIGNNTKITNLDPLSLLRSSIGKEADFRDGQLEAIEKILNNERILVVQRTGWGKSIVYFITTKILRDSNKGPTIIISPLLSLIRNQMQAAFKLGLSVESINSTNEEDHTEIIAKLGRNQIDILMISPEQLANEARFSKIQKNISSLGLFVVDEAHCISDWGHDFRPDYRRIVDYIKLLPGNIPILATTATANDRVVKDISDQLGNINVIRGPLVRESLRLKTLVLQDEAERLSWLEINLPKFEGSGIVYCLTKRTTHRVTEFLRSKGINAREYNADFENSERQALERLFDENKVKCLVATVALGMGYDKPDISFVIHFQRPGNLITYYQQIGRAGRNLDNAIVVLLSGREDDEIQQYFIDSAFPTEAEMTAIVDLIENSDGMKKPEILRHINMKDKRVELCLKYLQVEKVLSRDNELRYFRTLNKWSPNNQRSALITARRYEELRQIKEFVTFDGCLMEYISKSLDDPYAKACGKCMNCDPDFPTFDDLPLEKIVAAQEFINKEVISIEQRRRWPYSIDGSTVIPDEKQYRPGRTLCIYGDSGYGKMIAEDKYKNEYIRKELVDASVKLIRNWSELPKNDLCVCYIPSKKRPNLVKDFAKNVAIQLQVPIFDILEKNETGYSQKNFQNSANQMENAMKSFSITKPVRLPSNILLIDDIVDSRWTIVAATIKLKEMEKCEVFPFTIANSNGKVEQIDV